MSEKLYPENLFQYANDGGIAVKKVVDSSSGWTGEMIKTSLIKKMDVLINDIKTKTITKPISIYLVGGPGNGKTAAAEYFIKKLYQEVVGKVCECKEIKKGRFLYDCPVTENITGVILVEDATSASNTKESVGTIIAEANEIVLRPSDSREIYVCCINRGILSDCAREDETDDGVVFLENVSRTVAVSAESAPVWPLIGNKAFPDDEIYKSIYVWPMDIESLLDSYIYGDYGETPAANILSKILEQDVNHCLNCPNRDLCPFFFNYQSLKEPAKLQNLVQVLYEFEIAIGKKLLFRDIFSIFNVLLVGDENDYKSEPLANIGQKSKKITPCAWVAQNVKHIEANDNRSLASVFNLASKQYHYILFGNWGEFYKIDNDLKEASPTFEKLTKLFEVISKKDRNRKKTSSAWELIHETFSQIMDVAFVEESPKLEQLEEAFSSSFRLGVETLVPMGELSAIEKSLFESLKEQEMQLENEDFQVGSAEERTASKYLKATKVLGSRLAKRAVGIKIPAVHNGAEIEMYCRLLHGEEKLEVKKIREALHNILFGDNAISMMHNFAQKDASAKKFYLLPEALKIKQVPVQAMAAETNKVISNNLVLRIENTNIDIPVSFELYLALKQFNRGISIAALPEQVFAQLNLISSKVLGWLIHFNNEELRFRLGEADDGVVFEKSGDIFAREDA